MDGIRKTRLILFSDTFPYGSGETFLAEELPYLAERFGEIIIHPLYIPHDTTTGAGSSRSAESSHGSNIQGRNIRSRSLSGREVTGRSLHSREVPENVVVGEPLLPFDHKNRGKLLLGGVFGIPAHLFSSGDYFIRRWFATAREFVTRTLAGREIMAGGRHGNRVDGRRAPLGRRIWIFADYLLLFRSMLGNRKTIDTVLRECLFSDTIYFYWGDKSVMLAGYLKKRLSSMKAGLPLFCARFHGSDLYEGAKGYLPFRREIYSSIDYAAPVSEHGAGYINECLDKYRDRRDYAVPVVRAHHLGSRRIGEASGPAERGAVKLFRIVSCSNLIELKRVHLIPEAIKIVCSDRKFVGEMVRRGIEGISWNHFGGGKLFAELREKAADLAASFGTPEFRVEAVMHGRVPHDSILDYYSNGSGTQGADLFMITSRSEGVPVSIMEAMSYGIPVIATDVGGVSELFKSAAKSAPAAASGGADDNGTGLLLPPDPSAELIAEKLSGFMLLPEKSHANLRDSAFANWRDNWNAAKNYSDFADSITALS